MLTDFHRFSKFVHRQTCQWICSTGYSDNKIYTTTPQYPTTNHPLPLQLHCLVKCLSSKTAMLQNSAIWNSCWNKSSSDVRTILLTDENIFRAVTSKNPQNHQLYATAAIKKKKRHDKTLAHTIRQSLMASVGESQVVEKTRVSYLPITESRTYPFRE